MVAVAPASLGMADWEDGCWGRYVILCRAGHGPAPRQTGRTRQTGQTGREEGARERRRWERRVGDDGCGKVKGATTHVPLTPESYQPHYYFCGMGRRASG